MSERDDNRYGEDICVGFAIYCDENALTVAEGIEFAERLADGVMAVAEDRSAA